MNEHACTKSTLASALLGVADTILHYMLTYIFIRQVAGLVLIGVGVVVQTAYNDYFAFFGGQLNSAAIFLVIIGVIVFVVGFFGCCGAYKENHCMIITVGGSTIGLLHRPEITKTRTNVVLMDN